MFPTRGLSVDIFYKSILVSTKNALTKDKQLKDIIIITDICSWRINFHLCTHIAYRLIEGFADFIQKKSLHACRTQRYLTPFQKDLTKFLTQKKVQSSFYNSISLSHIFALLSSHVFQEVFIILRKLILVVDFNS
jgi:hypothetical protein